MPFTQYHFDLSPTEFRDTLALRYRRPLSGVPANCDGCNEQFTLIHALDCKRGGLVVQRHNEVRDALGDLASLVWNKLTREPIVQEADDAANTPALVADLGVRGLWQPQAEALIDVRVIDTDAQSHCHRPITSVLASAETEKKRKYHHACERRRAAFTPFVVSVDGILGKEAKTLIDRLSDRLASKWGKSYEETVSWVRTRLSFAVLRATDLCIWGSRTRWRSLGIHDGATMSLCM